MQFFGANGYGEESWVFSLMTRINPIGANNRSFGLTHFTSASYVIPLLLVLVRRVSIARTDSRYYRSNYSVNVNPGLLLPPVRSTRAILTSPC